MNNREDTMEKQNEMQIVFDARSENEGFARMAVAAFISPLNPTIDELADVKTAVSEAVTNCIIHGYRQGSGKIFLECTVTGSTVTIGITDEGVWSRCLPPDPSWNGPVWDLLLWKPLWMMCRCIPAREKEPEW